MFIFQENLQPVHLIDPLTSNDKNRLNLDIPDIEPTQAPLDFSYGYLDDLSLEGSFSTFNFCCLAVNP